MYANNGILNSPLSIVQINDNEGREVKQFFGSSEEVADENDIFLIRDLMKSVIDNGTGGSIRWKYKFYAPAAGKTGTTNAFKDAWFNGFTKDISTSVWVGFDNNDSMKTRSGKGLTGASAAAPIWVHFMQKALEGKTKVKFPVPDNIKLVTVDVKTGKLPDEFSLEKIEIAVKEDVDLSPLPIENPISEVDTKLNLEVEKLNSSSN